MSVLTVLGNFDCHRYHWPPPEDADDHHVVPQAWQTFWRPSSGVPTAAGVLWHPQTARLTPSCHRAVHNRIETIMRDFAASPRRRSDPEQVVLDDAMNWGSRRGRRGRLWAIALQAPFEWLASGGSLNALVDARLWGNS